MLSKTLNFFKDEINAYLEQRDQVAYSVVLGNVALLETQLSGNLQEITDNIVLSLINIEEEYTLKNEPAIEKVGTARIRRNPPIYFNLYLLFSATIQNYDEGLKYLSRVIEFFQNKKFFTPDEYPGLVGTGIQRLVPEFHDLSFEQYYNLYSVLGSKLFPNALYKVRLIGIQASAETPTGIVEEIIMNDSTI
jgi:hypothetical protein